MCVNGQHLGFSSGEVLGLSEAWPLCLPCCRLCWPGCLELSPGACQADLLEAGSVLATLLPFPGIGRLLLPPPPPLSPVLTLLCPPLLWADAQIAVMQQRIDRLALLHEKQAASPLEPRELEELRGKNERYSAPYRPSQSRGRGDVLFPHCSPPLQPHHTAPRNSEAVPGPEDREEPDGSQN